MFVYTLQSHCSFGVLGNQIQAIRDNLAADCIYVVQGPYKGPLRSDVRLTAESAANLGVEIIESPNFVEMGPMLQRPIFAWLLAENKGQDCVILQSDTFPSRPMTMNELLDGHVAAGRGYVREGRQVVHYTWMAVSKAWDGVFEPPFWDGDFKFWPCVRDGLFENCEPGWWHADRIHSWHMPGGIDKTDEVKRRFPTSLTATTEVVPASACIGAVMAKVSTTGDRLHDLIRRYLHQDYRPGCGCKKVVEQMNSHAPAWTIDNMPMLVGKLQQAARERNWWTKLAVSLPGNKYPIRFMIREAVRLATEDAKQGG